MRTSMPLGLALLNALLLVGCGSKPPPPPAAPAASAAPHGDDPNRPLTRAECTSLGQTIVDACTNRGNERSSEMEGWCDDMVRRNSDGTWIDDDCLKHFKYMDAYCFQGANNAHAMMDCDRNVDRSQ